jgi:hypothetical protein
VVVSQLTTIACNAIRQGFVSVRSVIQCGHSRVEIYLRVPSLLIGLNLCNYQLPEDGRPNQCCNTWHGMNPSASAYYVSTEKGLPCDSKERQGNFCSQ